MSAVVGSLAERRRLGKQAVAARLMERCAAGDHQALAQLYELFADGLLRAAQGIVRNREEAEEIVQEVFLYAWEHASDYDPSRAAVSTWLGRIVRSRSIDRFRRAAVADRARLRIASEESSSFEPRAEERLARDEWRQRLQRAIRSLPAPQREALVLAYYGGLTQSEIAERARIPLGTVKTRTHLALRKLRAADRLTAAAAEDGLRPAS